MYYKLYSIVDKLSILIRYTLMKMTTVLLVHHKMWSCEL